MDKKFQPTWESLDARPLPTWYDDAKLGIFIHWGIYSLPAYAPKRSEVESQGQAYAEWFAWFAMQEGTRQHKFLKDNYGSNATYEDLAASWKGELFDADRTMKLVKDSGAKYVIPVTKHHDGFCLWPSYYSWNWNSVDVGLHRDVIGELMAAADRHGIERGLYISLLEFNVTHKPEWQIDTSTDRIKKYADVKLLPQLKELVETYKPSLLFADGSWDYTSDHWKSRDFLAWLYNESSVKDRIVVNDRWGDETMAHHGGYYTCEYGTVNNRVLSDSEMEKLLGGHKFEECRSIGESFGFNRNEDSDDYLSEEKLIEFFVKTVSRGGNLNLNIGPMADGSVPSIMQERLRQLGDWLRVNGEGIYCSRPVKVAGLPEYAVATQREGNLYLFFRKFPIGREFKISSDLVKAGSHVSLLGSGTEIEQRVVNGCAEFKLPALSPDEFPCRVMYGIKIGAQK